MNLALVPLVSAIAAGNHVYLKPSEHTPRTAALLRALLAEVFPPDRVAVALGGAEVGAAFAALAVRPPAVHRLDRGRPQGDGRRRAEPDPGDAGAGRQGAGAGRGGLPDRTWPPRASPPASGSTPGRPASASTMCWSMRRAATRSSMRCAAKSRRATATSTTPADYTRIINDAQFARLRGYLDDARARGCTVIELAAVDDARRAPRTPVRADAGARPARRCRADAPRDLRPDPAGARPTARWTRRSPASTPRTPAGAVSVRRRRGHDRTHPRATRWPAASPSTTP